LGLFCLVTGHREIERKFLVDAPPRGWSRESSSRIAQGYFSLTDRTLEIRLRRKDKQCCITFKAGRGLNRFEEEISISAAQFRALWSLTERARIHKRRYRIRSGPHVIELDVYQGPHQGLITAEVEFDNEGQRLRLRPPPWFGREVTRNSRFRNARLARSQGLPAMPKAR
jgi:adenylate cyclase